MQLPWGRGAGNFPSLYGRNPLGSNTQHFCSCHLCLAPFYFRKAVPLVLVWKYWLGPKMATLGKEWRQMDAVRFLGKAVWFEINPSGEPHLGCVEFFGGGGKLSKVSFPRLQLYFMPALAHVKPQMCLFSPEGLSLVTLIKRCFRTESLGCSVFLIPFNFDRYTQ